jgi:hypothetical protein
MLFCCLRAARAARGAWPRSRGSCRERGDLRRSRSSATRRRRARTGALLEERDPRPVRRCSSKATKPTLILVLPRRVELAVRRREKVRWPRRHDRRLRRSSRWPAVQRGRRRSERPTPLRRELPALRRRSPRPAFRIAAAVGRGRATRARRARRRRLRQLTLATRRVDSPASNPRPSLSSHLQPASSACASPVASVAPGW